MKEILKYLKPHAGKVALTGVLLFVSTLADLFLPALMSEVVNTGINGQDMSYIGKVCAVMAAVAAVGLAALLFSMKLSASVTSDFASDLAADVFKRAERMDYQAFQRFGTGALLTRSTEDIAVVQDVFDMILRCIVMVPVLLAGGAALAFSRDAALAGILLLFAPFVIAGVFFVSTKLEPRIERSERYIDKQNTIVRERLTGIRVIRAFNREDAEHERMAGATRVMADNIIRANVMGNLLNPLSVLILNLVTVLILYVAAGRMTPGGVLAAGDVVAVIQYVALIMSAIVLFSTVILYFPRVRVSFKRIGEVFAAKTVDLGEAERLEGGLELKNVTYRYEGAEEPALVNVSFSAKAGETVALIGGTGAGKSTLLLVLAGFYRPESGEVLLGGRSYAELTPASISANVSAAFQKCDVFSGTVRENVDMGGGGDAAGAIADAELAEFVERAGGDGHTLNQGGSNLSGGQKQRLAIARAINKDAAVYLFDDSFSALDFLTEYRLRNNLRKRLSGKTQVIATQRVATARGADRIYVLDGGKVAACGTHAELVESSPLYKEICLSQMGGEGL